MSDPVLTAALREELGRVGSVDVVIAVPASSEAAATDHAIAAVQVGLARLLPEARGLVVTLGGPVAGEPPVATGTLGPDAVVEALGHAPAVDVRRLHLATARTGEAWLRAALEIAAVADAAAVVALDGDLAWAVPEWVDALAGPLVDGQADLVLPLGTRHRFDAVPAAILATPLTRALYGRRVGHVAGGPLGIGRALFEPVVARGGDIECLGVTLLALARGLRVAERRLGVVASAPGTSGGDALPGARRLVAVLLTTSAAEAAAWRSVRGSEDLARGGFPRPGDAPAVRVDPVSWLGTFADAAATHREAWAATFATPTLNAVLGLAVTAAGVGLSARDWLNLDRGADIGRLDTATLAGAMATFQFPDDAWVRVVHDALLAAGPGGRRAEDVADALAPVVLGRAASFVVEARRARADDVVALLERQALAFERAKPDLVARWTAAESEAAGTARTATIA